MTCPTKIKLEKRHNSNTLDATKEALKDTNKGQSSQDKKWSGD